MADLTKYFDGNPFEACPIENTVGVFEDDQDQPEQVYDDHGGFRSVEDGEVWAEFYERRPTLRGKAFRDTFAVSVLYRDVATRKYSVQLKRPILNFRDACANALAVMRMWKETEDGKEQRAQGRAHAVANKQMIASLNAEWREAIENRKAAIAEWDAIVAAKREAWHAAKFPPAIDPETPVA